jgi:class II lanthipeptide synthase
MCSDDAFVAAALSIGRRIVADAVWQDGVCSWVGAVAEPTPPWRAQYRALDGVVYDGTAGVGLFLAHLAAVTGEAEVRRTALGAFRHAASRARHIPPSRRDGFHAGSLGIAWAVARGAALLEDGALEASARALPRATMPPSGSDRRHDVVTGSAGTILALLGLATALDEPARLDDAIAVGAELIGAATVTRHGWSWATPDQRRRAHLCGLSHGAAGIGWALLELFAATDDERFRVAAMGAFDYERSWFDADSGTWPDLRVGGQRRGADRAVEPPTFGSWCSGEGGIALTRLRGIAILGPEANEEDAELALAATRRELARALTDEIDDLTLCHGAAGAADVLLCGAAALGGQWREAEGVADELGYRVVERYGATNRDWPCGASGGTSPSLFRGLSGIGWWLLRLRDANIPSPLAMPTLTPVHAQA